jgi:hypothetical protein
MEEELAKLGGKLLEFNKVFIYFIIYICIYINLKI